MFTNSPHSGSALDRFFPFIAAGLIVILIVGLAGVSGYVLLGRPALRAAVPVQAAASRADAGMPTAASLRPAPTATPSPAPTLTPRPTYTPVVVAAALAEAPAEAAPAAEQALTPLPTPPMPQPTLAAEGAPEAVAEMPQTGLGLFGSAGLGAALIGLFWGARSLRMGRRR